MGNTMIFEEINEFIEIKSLFKTNSFNSLKMYFKFFV